MRYSDIQLLNEKHWKKRSDSLSSPSSNFKDKKHTRHNRHEHEHEPEHNSRVPHHDSHKRHKRRIKQRNQHNNHEHNKGRHFNKKRRNRISINLNTPRVQYRRPLPRTSSTTTTERVPQEWDGNQWVDANSTEFVTTTNQSRPDNTMSREKLDWDGGEWNAKAGVTMADLDAANDTQKMMHQNYELNKRQKK
jgi:hypothetical protein